MEVVAAKDVEVQAVGAAGMAVVVSAVVWVTAVINMRPAIR